jgi:hypothetical protein
MGSSPGKSVDIASRYRVASQQIACRVVAFAPGGCPLLGKRLLCVHIPEGVLSCDELPSVVLDRINICPLLVCCRSKGVMQLGVPP